MHTNRFTDEEEIVTFFFSSNLECKFEQKQKY